MLEDNELLYTFTTIAQSIAAAFGLLAAFVLYRLQSLDGAMSQDTLHFLSGGYFSKDEVAALESLRAQKRYGDVLKVWDNALVGYRKRNVADPTGPWGDSDARRARIAWGVEAVQNARLQLQRTLWPTAVTVFYCTAAIPFVHMAIRYLVLSAGMLAIALAVLALCLMMYLRLIAQALGPPNQL